MVDCVGRLQRHTTACGAHVARYAGGSYIACVLANKVARSTRGGGGLLLSERGLQVAQHTDLAEQDRSGVVAVERAHRRVTVSRGVPRDAPRSASEASRLLCLAPKSLSELVELTGIEPVTS